MRLEISMYLFIFLFVSLSKISMLLEKPSLDSAASVTLILNMYGFFAPASFETVTLTLP